MKRRLKLSFVYYWRHIAKFFGRCGRCGNIMNITRNGQGICPRCRKRV